VSASTEPLVVHLVPDTAEFDAWVASLRLLVSQLGFVLDTYLESRPPIPEQRS
jgi:hypothetical protein